MALLLMTAMLNICDVPLGEEGVVRPPPLKEEYKVDSMRVCPSRNLKRNMQYEVKEHTNLSALVLKFRNLHRVVFLCELFIVQFCI
jgi:hypothetical protein